VLLRGWLCVVGVAPVKARGLPGASRWLPLAIPTTVVVGAAVASNVGSNLVSLAWTGLVALACAGLGVALHHTNRPAIPA
jgi:hypothetical protein